jgi:NAD(P)-dependent dehydrogenase (short-subunit alcohol dehydrogenase family)
MNREEPMTRSIQELLDLNGRTAIVTGGGTHLGTAFTEALSDLGAKVYIASRRYAMQVVRSPLAIRRTEMSMSSGERWTST